MSQIYSIIPAAHQAALNAFFEVYGWGSGTYNEALTTDAPATAASPKTHFHNYNATALPSWYTIFSTAKAGTLPTVDMNGQPIDYGVNGVVGEADALAAFAELQLWANDSDEDPFAFAEGRRMSHNPSLLLVPSGIEF